MLSSRRYLTGPETRPDWRLFTTLVVDPVYVGHFSATFGRSPTTLTCRLRSRPLSAAWSGIDHRYAASGPLLRQPRNSKPNRIIPLGPHVDYALPRDRERLGWVMAKNPNHRCKSPISVKLKAAKPILVPLWPIKTQPFCDGSHAEGT